MGKTKRTIKKVAKNVGKAAVKAAVVVLASEVGVKIKPKI